MLKCQKHSQPAGGGGLPSQLPSWDATSLGVDTYVIYIHTHANIYLHWKEYADACERHMLSSSM